MRPIYTRRALMMGGLGTVAMASLPGTIGVAWAQGSGSVTVRLGYQPDLLGSIAMVALKERIFEAVGARVDARRIVTGRQIRDAMIAGHLDLGNYGGPTFVVGAAKGDLVAIAVFAHAGRSFHIIVRQDSPIRTVADLKGKKVGGILGGSVYPIFKNRIAPKFGLAERDYEAINITGPDQIPALATRQVDAIAAVEPYVSIGEDQGIVRSILDYSGYDLSPVILCARPEFVDQHPAALVIFLKAWIRAGRLMKEQPARAAAAVWEVFKEQGYQVSEAVIAKAMGRYDIRFDFSPELRQYLEVTAAELLRDKSITRIPDWSRALRAEFLAKALAD